jgi:hypothetical protein
MTSPWGVFGDKGRSPCAMRPGRGGPAGEPKAEPTNDLLLFPDKNVVDLLPVWGDARCRDSPGFAISRHFAD